MLILSHRTYSGRYLASPHLSFVYEIRFLFKKRIGLHCVSVLISGINFFPFTRMKTQKNWVYDEKNIYSSPVYGIVCLYNGLWRHSQARVKRFLTVTVVLRDDSHFRNNIPRTHETKKLAFLMWELTILRKVRETGTSGLLLPANRIMGVSAPSYYQTQCRKCQAASWGLSSSSQRCAKSNTTFCTMLPAPNITQMHELHLHSYSNLGDRWGSVGRATPRLLLHPGKAR